MKLDRDEVEKVAGLARLALSEEEMERFSHQLSSILTHMEELNRVMTDNIDPSYSLGEEPTPMREDIVRPSLSQEEALLNAPVVHAGFFKVPKILNDR